jgi:hypothetical protein
VLLDGEHLRSLALELDPGPALSSREIAQYAIRTALGRDPQAGPSEVLGAVETALAEYQARLVSSDAARLLATYADRTRRTTT